MKRVLGCGLVVALLVWWLLPTSAQTTTFYVRTDGHDTASGANNTSDPTTGAWLTIGKCTSTLTAGQTCIVADGTYTESPVERSNGSAGSPITYRAANQYGAVIVGGFYVGGYSGDGDYVVVDGFKVVMPSGAQFGIWINGEHDTIQNNWVTSESSTLGSNNAGLQIENLSVNALVTRNLIERVCFGALLYGTSNTLSYNHFTDLRIHSGCGDVDNIRVFQDGHQILYNAMYGTEWANVGAAHLDCIQTFDNTYTASNILIEGNYCNNVHQGMMLQSTVQGGSTSWTVRNNVFVNIHTWCVCAFAIADMHFINNTCHVIGEMPTTAGNGFYCRFSPATCEFKNNIVYHAAATTAYSYLIAADDGATYIDGDASAPGENNLLYAPNLTLTGFAEDIINQDPQFMDLGNGNLHPKTISPARNAGQTIAGWSSPTDRDGLSRPQQTNWAIGAYEWTGVPAAPSNPRIQ